MLKSKINQELENIINLIGEQVSFVSNLKVQEQFFSENVQGVVTDVLLSLDGNHQISVGGSDFFNINDLVDFKVLDAV